MFLGVCIYFQGVIICYGWIFLCVLQMLKKVKEGKVSYKLAETAEKAKTLVTVGGLSEASAEGTV